MVPVVGAAPAGAYTTQDVVNEETGEVLVDAPEKHTWWRTKWMTLPRFSAHEEARGRSWNASSPGSTR